MNSLFQALQGLYIAALAAIATFDEAKRGYDLDGFWTYPAAILREADGHDRPLMRRHLVVNREANIENMALVRFCGDQSIWRSISLNPHQPTVRDDSPVD
jgi:hypothetical protein